VRESVGTPVSDAPARQPGADESDSMTASGRTTSGGVLRILRARWWLVLSCVAVAMAAAVVYLSLAARIYTSTAMIHVEQNMPNVVLDGVDHSTRFDNYLYTQAELMKTTPILGEVAKHPSVRDCRTLRGTGDPVPVLQSLLDCVVGKKNDIISVSFSSPYPDEAAQLLNLVVHAYLDYHSRNTRDTASEILRILKEARQTGSVELSQAMAKVLDFRRANGVLFLDNEKGNLITQRLAMLSDELTRAELDRIQTQVSYEAMLAVQKSPARVRELFRSLEPNAPASTQERTTLTEILGAAEVRCAGLLQKHAPAHPAVLEASAESRAARDQLERHDKEQLDAIIAVTEQRYRAAEKKESELKAAMSKQRELAMDFNGKAVEYAMLESDLKRREHLCDILEGRIKDIDIRGDAGGLNIAVLEWAKVAACPSRPEKTRIFALALTLGLALGIGVALAREWLDDRIRKPADLTGALGLRLLGEVPFIRDAAPGRLRSRQEESRVSRPAGEEYDDIRAILCSPGSRDGGATILLTSPAEGEGKTSTVQGLAVAIAQTGARTLVVDGDFLNPRQHEVFGLRQAPGLSELLTGEAPLTRAISPTTIPGLDLLPCGVAPDVVPQAIRSGTCLPLLELLALAYDYILVDSPSALASTDARVLAAGCDKTVLVLRANQSAFATAVRAHQTLRRAGAAVIGAVLNACRATR
jgi:polysaccharide biosynthesis transport protein